MSDWTLRAEDNGEVLLDNDGQPIRELAPDSADALLDRGDSLRELAQSSRSWRFGHVIVDEAQDLTPMQWRMVARRTRANAVTVVGDLAQRSIGPPGTWADHLPDAMQDHEYRVLTTNYRSPSEVADVAALVLAELAPDLPAPSALRSAGERPRAFAVNDVAAELPMLLRTVQADHPDGRVAVIGAEAGERTALSEEVPDVTWLTAREAKGLEFDVVVVVEPGRIAASANGLSLLYVAVTRATRSMALVHTGPLPALLAPAFGPLSD